MNLGLIDSKENDYHAKTFSVGVSQDVFGDLTTISLGYSLGTDEVRRRGDADLQGHCATPGLPPRRVADSDEESTDGPFVRSDHG